jgi:hypothetical protein
MTILNRYTTTILLSLTLLASQAFAVNTLGANQVTANIATTPAVQATTTPSHLQYQQQHTLTSNINNNHSHLQYQKQPHMTSNINNNPLSHPISTKTHSHLQYQQPPLSPPISTNPTILDVRGGCC